MQIEKRFRLHVKIMALAKNVEYFARIQTISLLSLSTCIQDTQSSKSALGEIANEWQKNSSSSSNTKILIRERISNSNVQWIENKIMHNGILQQKKKKKKSFLRCAHMFSYGVKVNKTDTQSYNLFATHFKWIW